jgi:hypothetical protein
MLRDLGEALGFYVGWDAASKMVLIDTTKPPRFDESKEQTPPAASKDVDKAASSEILIEKSDANFAGDYIYKGVIIYADGDIVEFDLSEDEYLYGRHTFGELGEYIREKGTLLDKRVSAKDLEKIKGYLTIIDADEFIEWADEDTADAGSYRTILYDYSNEKKINLLLSGDWYGINTNPQTLNLLKLISPYLDNYTPKNADEWEEWAFDLLSEYHPYDITIEEQLEKYDAKTGKLILSRMGLTDSDLAALDGIKNLKWLDLRGNNISDLTALGSAPNLTRLWLNDNNLSDADSLRNYKNFTKLDLTHNQISDLAPLAGLNKLTWLNLKYNQISELAPLAGLNKLIWLDLSYNPISDISVLKELTNLKSLRLYDNPYISKEQIDELKAALPNCQVFQ